jgi:hypothetical protein
VTHLVQPLVCIDGYLCAKGLGQHQNITSHCMIGAAGQTGTPLNNYTLFSSLGICSKEKANSKSYYSTIVQVSMHYQCGHYGSRICCCFYSCNVPSEQGCTWKILRLKLRLHALTLANQQVCSIFLSLDKRKEGHHSWGYGAVPIKTSVPILLYGGSVQSILTLHICIYLLDKI